MFKFYGFTLSELTVVIAILAITACFAVPLYRDLMISSEVDLLKKTLTIHIQKAKTDAQIYHKNVTLCASQDLMNCHNDWNKGFIGFVDNNQNRQKDPTEKLLFTNSFNNKYGSLDWRGTLRINSLTFQGDTGLPRGSNGSFFYCLNTSNHHTQIILSSMGHLRSQEISTC